MTIRPRGYVVVDDEAPHMPPLEYVVGGVEPDSLALWHGEASTLFWSKRQAEEAVATSLRYARETVTGYRARSFTIMEVAIEHGEHRNPAN